MIPRGRLDIGWRDLAFAAAACVSPGHRGRRERRLAREWSSHRDAADRSSLGSRSDDAVSAPALACLSVRSGFDALLSALDWPAGSEILVSAITIPDMPRIIEQHGFRAVPVDLDFETLAMRSESLERAASPRTRAVLAAHLFGSRMIMEPVLEFARRRGLVVIEDCAQCFAADGYRGDPESDASLFSFGPIKTATALGGALLTFRDSELREAVFVVQSRYPVQSRLEFLGRVVKYAFLKAFTGRAGYTAFVGACRLLKVDLDRALARSLRGFSGAELLKGLRRRPSAPLLALLERRIARVAPEAIEQRVRAARNLVRELENVPRPGRNAAVHSHWVFPIASRDPQGLVSRLRSLGFDATRSASSLHVVPPPSVLPHLRAIHAERFFARLVYLPVHADLSAEELRKLAEAVRNFEKAGPPDGAADGSTG